MIPYGKQSISDRDIDAVVKVLQSSHLTQGPVVPAFEKELAALCNANHAVAVNSATSALHIACLSLEVGPGDTVWTSPTTFVASANCARYCGAAVDFVDIDPDTWCLSVQRLQEKLELHKDRSLPLPKVVIPVHLSGQSCDMKEIANLGGRYGFKIIEDASHAVGGTYLGEPVGNCRYSDITVFSFHPVKIITTGEGGAALTNSAHLNHRMSLFRGHGITREVGQLADTSGAPWYYEQQELGFNYRMTDILAALGLSQLERLESFVTLRNQLAASYDESLTQSWIRSQKIPDEVTSSRHLYVVRVPEARHRKLFESMHHSKIGVNLHYMPVHLQPYYRSQGFTEGQFPESEAYGKEAISLPLYPEMKLSQHKRVIDFLTRYNECG